MVERLLDALLRSGSQRTTAKAARDAALIAAAGLVLLAVGAEPPFNSPLLGVETGSVWWRAAILLPFVGLVLLKYQIPVAAFLLGAGVLAIDQVFGGSIAGVIAFFDLSYTAFLWGPEWARKRLAAGLAVVAVAAVLVAGIVTGDARTVVLTALVMIAVIGTPVWWASSVRQHAELAALAEERAEAAETLAAARRDSAVAEERARMARDLHDALAGSLSAVAIHTEAARGAGTLEASRTALDGAREASVAAMRELRVLIGVLHDDERTAPPLLAEADRLLDAARTGGTEVSARVNLAPGIPVGVDQSAYRILQESLTNAARHGAGPIDVAVDGGPDGVRLAVTNAVGDGASGGTGLGLVSMRERVRALGGTLRAGPDDAGRWAVEAVLPAHDNEGEPAW